MWKNQSSFLDEISELGIIKLVGSNTYDTLTMKVKSERNKTFLEVTNDLTQVIVLDPKTAVDIRWLDYYKYYQGILQQRLCGIPLNQYKTYFKDTIILEKSYKKKLLS